MSAEELRALKGALFDEYGGFADKRFRNLDSNDTFIVDDRGRKDIGADKGLYSYFCSMFATAATARRVHLVLRGNVPMSEAVVDWAGRRSAELDDRSLSFDVTPRTLDRLGELEKAIRDIVKPGARYEVRSYKFVCPRTANSLRRLATVLGEHWDV